MVGEEDSRGLSVPPSKDSEMDRTLTDHEGPLKSQVTTTTWTKDVRLDKLVTYHYNQIQRNADILKDDLETIRKHCMVPDLPKLEDGDHESQILAKSILDQFDGVVNKHIDIMSKLTKDLRSQMSERLPEVSPPNFPTSTETKFDVSPSPSSSTTPEVDITVQQSHPCSEKPRVADSTAISDANECSTTTILNSAEQNEESLSDNDLSSSMAKLLPVLGVRASTEINSQQTSETMDVSADKLAEFELDCSNPNLGPPLSAQMADSDPPCQSFHLSQNANATQHQEPLTAVLGSTPETNKNVMSLRECPKLIQITKVILTKLSQKTLTKYENKFDHVKDSNTLDDLERKLNKLVSGDHFQKSASLDVRTSSSTRPLLPRRAKEKSKHSDDSSETSDVDKSSSDSDMDENSVTKLVICKDSNLDDGGLNDSYSELEDLEIGSACELEKQNKTEEKTTENESPANKKLKKRYFTPKLKFLLTSDSDETELKSKVKKEVGSESEKRAESKDGVDSDDETELLPIEENKNKNDEGSDSDFVVKKSSKNKKTFALDSNDSDFEPKEKLINTNTLKKTIAAICDTDSELETDLKSKMTRKRELSVSVSASDSDTSTKKKKKRRRIKKGSTTDSTDSDVVILDTKAEDKDSSKSPRKGLRKVMSKKELLKTTRQAGKEEEDRKRRVAENQKLYNKFLMAQTEKGDTCSELVLDFDKESKKPLLSVDPSIVKFLKPHQVEGIKFMWENCYESMKAIEKDVNGGGGCILAHCMGLGKTLQTIGFLHTVMSTKDCGTRRALVICPLNTVGNWFQEFRHWCTDCDVTPRLHRLWDVKGKRRFEALSDWQRMGGVGIIHYDSFRLLASLDEKKGKGKPSPRELQIVQSSLLDPGPDIVVCDEGHLLKNASTKQAQSVMKIRTARRVVLTGTPLQNDLMEYYTMMSFVKPNLLGTKKEFRNRFANPIEKGQHKSSDEMQVRLMKRRAHVLHKLLDGCVQRLDYTVLTPYLPPKHEYAISINLSELQKDLYNHYINNVSAKKKGSTPMSRQLLIDYMTLVKVWTHPVVLTYRKRNQASDEDSSDDSIKDFICDEETTDSDKSEKDETSDVEIICEEKKDESEGLDEGEAPVTGNWFSSFLKSQEDLQIPELSGKILVLFEILKTCALIGDKVLVFSQFLTSLDLIEECLRHLDQEAMDSESPVENQKKDSGRWRPNIEYFRIDGSVKSDDRQKSCKTFNQDRTSRAKLFLISTKAGGLGINLTGANRVVMFDASWNPSNDIQCIFRVYRFGQTKPCYIYRLLARGTMEEKIYNRQVVKLSLSCRVVDEQQIERHFQYDEVQAMYDFNPNDATERPTPAVPKDRLLADLLISHKDWIFSYLEHDSLLENKQEEELTEEERRAAWEEYKNEDKPKPSAFAFNINDPWNQTIVSELKKRFPDKPDVEIYQMTVTARRQFEEIRNLLGGLASPNLDPQRKAWMELMLGDITKNLKLIFGDDRNWTEIFKEVKSQPPVIPSQPRLMTQQQHQSSPRPVPNLHNLQNPSTSSATSGSGTDQTVEATLANYASIYKQRQKTVLMQQQLRQKINQQHIQRQTLSPGIVPRYPIPSPVRLPTAGHSGYRNYSSVIGSNNSVLDYPRSQRAPVPNLVPASTHSRPTPAPRTADKRTTRQTQNPRPNSEPESILPDIVDLC